MSEISISFWKYQLLCFYSTKITNLDKNQQPYIKKKKQPTKKNPNPKELTFFSKSYDSNPRIQSIFLSYLW